MSFGVDVLPTNTRLPGVNLGYNTRNALQGIQVSEKNALFVVQKTSEGNAENLKRYPIGSESAAIQLFGRGSTGHIAIRNALAQNRNGTYFAVAIENSGVAAQGAIDISGTATEGGRLRLTIGQESVSVVIRSGDAASVVRQNLLTALSSENLALQVNPTAGGTGIVLAAKCAGASGNTIGISTSTENGGGISFTISQMGNGTDDIKVDGLFSLLAKSKNNIISFPYDYDTTQGSGDFANLESYLKKVTDPIEQGSTIAVIGYIGDCSTNIPAKPNNPRIAFVNMRNAYFSLDAMVAQLTADILANPDPAIPLNNNILTMLSPDSMGTDYLRGEQEILLRNGITPLQITASGRVSIVRLVSTETVGVSEKVPDMWIRTLDYVREAIRAEVDAAIHKKKDTERNVQMVRGVILGVLLKLDEAEILKNVRDWSDRLIVVRNPDNIGTFLAQIPADAVIGLHGVIGTIDLIVS